MRTPAVSRWIVLLSAALAFIASAAPSPASTLVRFDAPGLARVSEAVVRARVVSVASSWDAEERFILTQVDLEVLERIRGAAARRIALRVPGGTVGDVTSEMVGGPMFKTGEEVVVFVGRWDDGVPAVIGYGQGVSRVARDAAGRKVLRGGAADGLPLAGLARRLNRAVAEDASQASGAPEPFFTLLDPPRRAFRTPIRFLVDERGHPTVDDPDKGVTASIGAAELWNTDDLLVVEAEAGPVEFHLGDGQSTLWFEDYHGYCQKHFCLAAAYVNYRRSTVGSCGGVEYFEMIDTDIFFRQDVPYRTMLNPLPCREGLPLENVVAHEVGHGVGLGHTDESRDLMFRFAGRCTFLSPSRNDEAGRDFIFGCELTPIK